MVTYVLFCLVKIVRYFRSLVYSIMKRRKQKPFKILGSMTTLKHRFKFK